VADKERLAFGWKVEMVPWEKKAASRIRQGKGGRGG